MFMARLEAKESAGYVFMVIASKGQGGGPAAIIQVREHC